MSGPVPLPEEVAAATDGIGERLAALRAERGVKVSELARQVGVSSSLISQIERSQSKPSVGTLFALARALDAPVDAFFADEDAPHTEEPPGDGPAQARERLRDSLTVSDKPGSPTSYLVKAGERLALDIKGGVTWERLTASALDGMEFLELVYAPRAESDSELYRHPGVEMVVVTQGRFVIQVGFERHELTAGDSIAFPSSIPHRYINPTDRESRAITVIVREDLSSLG